VPVVLRVDGLGRYGRDTEATVYFCVSEALRNAAKYASASSVQVSLAQSDGLVRFEVVDDGVGFDPDRAFAVGSGLTDMADRIDALEGALTIRSVPGEATRLAGELPATETDDVEVLA
jgi:signal transduction histidine kinase